VVRYGVAGDPARLDVVATDVRVDADGTNFTWRWDLERLSIPVMLPLLGAHNVLNATAALAVVRLLGHDVEAAAAVCRLLEPVPHRLQTVPTTNDIRVIDDSYNANPVGVHNGLDVLAGFTGRRILVTPGMVELGSVEDAENRRYGEHAARVCDDVIIMVSHPAREVLAGLRAGGMDVTHIHEARSLDEAATLIGEIAKAGDTVLFANDLPDTYL
jgi:UDP-N-acetylmuramoyl-tripeptide--D-alanyl-D-alanine ligase